jgi:hypothetical protein
MCRDDIWALEDKVRAAKWATSAAEQVCFNSRPSSVLSGVIVCECGSVGPAAPHQLSASLKKLTSSYNTPCRAACSAGLQMPYAAVLCPPCPFTATRRCFKHPHPQSPELCLVGADIDCAQAEIANQIDPLMLQVLEKCQQHKDQVLACQVGNPETYLYNLGHIVLLLLCNPGHNTPTLFTYSTPTKPSGVARHTRLDACTAAAKRNQLSSHSAVCCHCRAC